MADNVNLHEIEKKWQKIWEEKKVYKSIEDETKKKYYVLEMLPYPSGRLHMGHVRNYSIGDAIARYMRMNGYNVLHPIGWDAFGLPAENAAIKNKIHPREWTFSNIEYMKSQMKKLGFSYDWDRETATCVPEYYKWNQWFFLKMYENGLIYRKYSTVNWCNSCQTVLANEQVQNGKCWRDGTPVVQKKLEQWFIKITDYAERLLEDMKHLGDWPERVLTMQKNWIGKSHGALVRFKIDGSDEEIEIFTTRIDTIYGANAIILAPEHTLVEKLISNAPDREKVEDFIERMRNQSKLDRIGDTTKEGYFLGHYAINPFNSEKLPIWIANFILVDYGTGAIMSVPAHDSRDNEFAKKYNLPIKQVIFPKDGENVDGELFEDYGILKNSGEFSGLDSKSAMEKMAKYAEEKGFGRATVTYQLRDWGVSRQRYWGTPIPVVHCEKCGIVPVPYEDLPVKLPPVEEIDYKGGSPLENVEDFVNTTCPKCGGRAKRDTDTMDTFVDSSWYFLRYTDSKYDKLPVNGEKVKYWFPVDIYIGGIEHAVMHLIYMRFWWKMMKDIGLIEGEDEPVKKLLTQGMVIKDGAKMSKSLGNVVDPDEMIEKYSADTCRIFILFAAPPERDLDWSDFGIEGSHRFLMRVFRIVDKYSEKVKELQVNIDYSKLDKRCQALLRKTHQVIKKVTEDISERLHLNTAIASIMELTNELYLFENEGISEYDLPLFKNVVENLLKILSPFAPHITEELWHKIGHNTFLVDEKWPEYDSDLAREEETEIAIMVNGKLRDKIKVEPDSEVEDVFNLAIKSDKVSKRLEGRNIVKKIFVRNKILNIVVK